MVCYKLRKIQKIKLQKLICQIIEYDVAKHRKQ